MGSRSAIMESGNDPERKIESVFRLASKRVPEPYVQAEVKAFPYLELSEQKNEVALRNNNVNGLGIEQVELENNIRINLKATDFKKGEFIFKAVFGKGRAGMPESLYGLGSLVESAVDQSGFGSMDLDVLDTALAGKDVNIGFKINETSFSIQGSAAPRDAELVLQLLYTYFRDPGFKAKALELSKVHYRQKYDTLHRTPEGVMEILGNRFLAGGDPRFSLGTPVQADNLTIANIESWLRPEFEDSPLEISFAGDFDPNQLKQLSEIYLGSMEFRPKQGIFSGTQGLSTDKILFPKGETRTFRLDSRLNKAVARVAFLTDDYWDIMQTRQLSLLSRVLSERLRKTIRESLGASYSPYVYNNPSLYFKGYGVLNVVVNLSPDTVDTINNQITELIQDLVENGVTSEELSLVKGPVMNHLNVLRQTNSYWLNSVMADSFRHPERLDWALHLIQGYEGISKEDLNRLAKKYFQARERAVIKVLPQLIK